MSRFSASGIGEITVDRQALKKILEDNQAKHHEIFVKAVEIWQQQALKLVNSWAYDIKKGKRPHLYSDLPVPEEHLDDYKRAIRMLEMHTEDTITLTEEAFSRLVDDKWGWSDLFVSNTASYVALSN